MAFLKKLWKFLSSMKFAIILLIMLALACAGSSLISQGQSAEWYRAQYSERTAALILALRLDDAYHSWWFITISAFLCLNLILCNVIRVPAILKKMKAHPLPDSAHLTRRIENSERFFQSLHMLKVRETVLPDGRKMQTAVRNRIGYWGAWVCRLGILLLILGFGLGQLLQKEYTVYGVPGETRMVEGTDLAVTIEDFTAELRADDTVEQYTSLITVRDLSKPDSKTESAEISVNHPASMFGMDFSQNSTGWAAEALVYEKGKLLQQEVLCAGEGFAVSDLPDLVIFLNALYPDYAMSEGQGPMTLSGSLNNPAYLYSVYYKEEILGMNVLLQDPDLRESADSSFQSEALTIDDYLVVFRNPQNYTLIQIKKDSFSSLAFLGGILVMAGLLLAFFAAPARAFVVEEEDGTLNAGAVCEKLGALFNDQFEKAVLSAQKSPEEP